MLKESKCIAKPLSRKLEDLPNELTPRSAKYWQSVQGTNVGLCTMQQKEGFGSLGEISWGEDCFAFCKNKIPLKRQQNVPQTKIKVDEEPRRMFAANMTTDQLAYFAAPCAPKETG